MSLTPRVREEEATEEVAAVYEAIKDYFGLPAVPVIFQVMAVKPPYLEATFDKYTSAFAPGVILQKTKHLVALAVAGTRASAYMSALCLRECRRYGLDDALVVEAAAIADFFAGLSALSEIFHLECDIKPARGVGEARAPLAASPRQSHIELVEAPEDESAAGVYEEITRTFGIRRPPNIFSALAHVPSALETAWRRWREIHLPGALSRMSQEMVALAVSAVTACEYCVDAHTAVSRGMGLSDQGLVEAGAVVDIIGGMSVFANCFNLEPDFGE